MHFLYAATRTVADHRQARLIEGKRHRIHFLYATTWTVEDPQAATLDIQRERNIESSCMHLHEQLKTHALPCYLISPEKLNGHLFLSNEIRNVILKLDLVYTRTYTNKIYNRMAENILQVPERERDRERQRQRDRDREKKKKSHRDSDTHYAQISLRTTTRHQIPKYQFWGKSTDLLP